MVDKGVKGWLLFFCVILTIINPLATVGVYLLNFSGFSALHFFGIIDKFWITLITLFGMYAGISLWAVRPKAVTLTKAYLVTMAAYALYIAGYKFYILIPSGRDSNGVIQSVMALFRMLIWVGIWYSYLTKSKRVNATYQS